MSFTVGSPLPVQSCTNISTVDDDNVEGDQENFVSIVSSNLPDIITVQDPIQQSATLLDNDGMIILYRDFALNIYLMTTTVCAAVVVGFNPAIYTFTEEDGAVDLTLEVNGLNGVLECDINVTVILFDGTKASKCVNIHTGLILPAIQHSI